MRHSARRVLIVIGSIALACAATAPSARAEAQSAAQRRCLIELNRAGENVADLTSRALLGCVRSALRGRLPSGQTIAACVAADAAGRIAQARVTTEVAAARWCDERPTIGARDAADVNDLLTPLRQLEAVFGATPEISLAPTRSRPARACQLAVVRAMGAIARAEIREFNTCKEAGLESGAIDSAAALATCAGADPRGRVARVARNASRKVAATCAGESIADAFPGQCAAAAAADLVGCARSPVHCDVCLGLNQADRIAAPCHEFSAGVATAYCGEREDTGQSVARQWDEELLAAIRIDTPRPVVHARNLFHLSVAMWDAWASYDDVADQYVHVERASDPNVEDARNAAISFAAYRLLRHRFVSSPGAATTLARLDARLYGLGYDKAFTSTVGPSPAALGNRIAAAVIDYGLADGANEAGGYADPTYAPVNEPMVIKEPGTIMADPNRWQPLAFDIQIGQNGVPIPGKIQIALGARWRDVLPFALARSAPGVPYFSPLPPPLLGTASDAEFKDQAVEIVVKQSLLDVEDPTLIDASPGTRGNNTLGTNDGTGRPLNPVTGMAYAPNPTKRQDYFRVLGMFWADGPESETPPGHWNVVANGVSDGPTFEKRIGGVGPILDDLEWDVKLYLAINGAVHDAAIAAWEQKREFDSVRPISMIRYMGGLGQSSDPGGPSYHPDGLPLVPGVIEVVTPESSAPGERHESLAAFVGEIALRSWRGEPANPRTQIGASAGFAPRAGSRSSGRRSSRRRSRASSPATARSAAPLPR
jgi:hypothetical protein